MTAHKISILHNYLQNSLLKPLLAGGVQNVICTDKSRLNREKIIEQCTEWLQFKLDVHPGREYAYVGLKPRLIVESYLQADTDGGLIDWKFYCFQGKVKYLGVFADRVFGQSVCHTFYDRDFKKLNNYYIINDGRLDRDIPKPENYEELVHIAEKLSEDFPHVRVDLYDIKGKIIFGELTFYDGSGYNLLTPDKFDFEMGACFDISSFYKG